MSGVLFISYSHIDQRWMQIVRMHLEGALRDSSVTIWSDKNVPPGQNWEDVLGRTLKGSAAALVLASPEYLVSDWCRRELKLLRETYAKGELSAIYWMMLRPCNWQLSGLRDLQAVHEPANAAIEAVDPGPTRDQLVVDLCARVASDLLLRAGTYEDPDVAFVRELMQQHGKPYRPKVDVSQGCSAFAIICRGRDPYDRDIVIKVLMNTPLHRLQDLFRQVSEARRQVHDPSVIRVHDIFMVGTGHAARLVIVSDLAPEKSLGTLIDEQRGLDTESVGTILRRLAEALAQLHKQDDLPTEVLDEPYRYVMGPLLPESVFWDDHMRRPLISLVSVTNFLWQFFEPTAFEHIVRPKSGTYVAPEQRCPGKVDKRTDQYFLGLLALELLECKRLFRAADSLPPLVVLRASDRPWKRHRQLANLLERLLAKRPDDRFSSMQVVAEQLRALEETDRVLAKHAFRTWVEEHGRAFSALFYKRFFGRDEVAEKIFDHAFAARVPGAALLSDAHHDKFIASLVAVLNYHRGNEPTSIVQLLPHHRGRAIGATQLLNFRDSFLATLEDQVEAPAEERKEIVDAWRKLFEPVLEELARELKIEGWPPPEVPAPSR